MSELRNMADGRGEQRGCCRRNPVCCGTTLILVAGFSFVVAVALGATYHPLRNKVDEIIKSVSTHVAPVACRLQLNPKKA